MKTPVRLTIHCRHSVFTLALAALLASQSAQAVTTYWTGAAGVGNTDVATAANWGGTQPPSGNTWGFNAAGTSGTILTNTLTSSAFNVQGIAFGSSSTAAPPYTLSGNTFTLTGDISNTTAAVTQTLNLDIIMGVSSHNFSSTWSTGSLVLKGVLSGPFNAVFAGLGTTTLNSSGSNSYGAGSGNVTAVTGGSTLILDFANMATPTDLIKNASTLQLGSGTTGGGGFLTLKGKSTGATSQTLGAVALNNYANNIVLNSNGGTSTTLNLGVITRLSGNSSINIDLSSANTAVNSSTAAGTLGYATLKDASGTGFASASGFTLTRLTGQTTLLAGSNAAAADYVTSGTVTKTAGAFSVNTLTLDASGGAGALDLGGSTMTVTQKGLLAIGSNAYTLSNGQVGAFNTELLIHTMGTGGVTLSALLGTATQALIKNGPDTLTLSATNTYTGPTIINGGTLKAGSSQAFGVGSAVTLSNNAGAVLDITGFDNTVASLTSSGPSSIILGAATLTVGNATSTTFAGVISGTGSLVKVGTGLLTLSGVNTLTGGVTIKAGALTQSNIASMGTVNLGDTSSSAAATYNAGYQGASATAFNIVASGSGTRTLASTAGNNTLSGAIVLNNDLALLDSDNGNTIFSGGITGTGNVIVNTSGTTGNETFSGGALNFTGALTFNNDTVINGTFVSAVIGSNVTGLVKNGSKTLTLSTANPAFIGDTILTAGTLIINQTNALQTSVLARNGGTSSFGTAITAATLGGLAGTVDLNLVNTNATPAVVNLTLGNSNASYGGNTLNPNYSGVIGQTTGTASLTKVGTNTQTLSGANTYSGATKVNGGTLAVAGSTAAGSTVTIGGASATGSPTLTGTGTVNGAVTIAAAGVGAAGTISPGTVGTTGTLHVGATAIAGTYACDLNGGSSDLLASTGTLTLSTGATLAITAVAPTASSYTIATYSGATPAFTTVTGLPSGYAIAYTTTAIMLVQTDPFNGWIVTPAFSLTGGQQAKAADPDGDGQTNITEFALDGNPASGAADHKVVGKIASVGGTPALVLTLPVRTGATFSAPGYPTNGELVSATVDHLVYEIQGGTDIASWTEAVTEVLGVDKTAIELGLPALSASGWTYRTFSSPLPVSGTPKDFLRAVIIAQP